MLQQSTEEEIDKELESQSFISWLLFEPPLFFYFTYLIIHDGQERYMRDKLKIRLKRLKSGFFVYIMAAL